MSGSTNAMMEPPSKDDKTMALIAHLSGLFFSPVAPLAIWLIKKDESAFVAYHALQALIFQGVIYALLFLIGGPINLLTCGIGLFLIFAVLPLQWGGAIMLAIKAHDGKMDGYPLLDKYGRPQPALPSTTPPSEPPAAPSSEPPAAPSSEPPAAPSSELPAVPASDSTSDSDASV